MKNTELPEIFPLSNKRKRSVRDLHIHQLSLDGYCDQQIGKAYKMPSKRVAQIFTEQTEKKLKERIAELKLQIGELKRQIEEALIYVSKTLKAGKNLSLVETVNASPSEQAKREYRDLINNAVTFENRLRERDKE
jgi:hypothetical protein